MKNNNRCLDCGIQIDDRAKRCWGCYLKWRENPKNHPSYTNGITLEKHYCLDCNKEINYKAERCSVCANEKINNPNWKNGKPHCIECGKLLSDYNAKRCVKCYSPIFKNQGKEQLGNNHPNWQGGKSFEEYGKEFDSSLKEQIRFRDHYECQNCGCSQLENGKQLDAHHKDYNKKNNILTNLIALCKSCHTKTNFNRNYWKDFYNKKLIQGVL